MGKDKAIAGKRGKEGPWLGSNVLHVDAESACSEIAFELFCRIVLRFFLNVDNPSPVYMKTRE